MDTTSLKSLHKATIFHFRSKASLFRPFNLFHLQHTLHLFLPSHHRLSPFCSLNGVAEMNEEITLPHGVGKAVNEASLLKILQETQVPLLEHAQHQLLDYTWLGYVVVKVHDSWADFCDYFSQQEGEKRLCAFTRRGTKVHSEFSYRKGDYLLFGSETGGLPPEVLLDCNTEPFGGGTIRIPIVETYVRCLNLSVSVGIALYEASRQLNYEQLQAPSVRSIDTEQSSITEDIFG